MLASAGGEPTPIETLCNRNRSCPAGLPEMRPRPKGRREVLRAFVVAFLLLAAVPAAAGAAAVGVEPYRERPDADPFGSCGHYMMCPPDMVVLTAATGETNYVAITEAVVGLGQTRYLVRDERAPVVAGAGCERVDDNAA